ncbi:hypothetical protein NEUTE1DRAFT_117281 [Neurospora tetrasperma FGSC 2508]|uniref:Uncharacterized protein n=1 Tax=Neurospora tetrasperma (strain FGSC 2508 / ATCC MYA-4615 / P0657) TaxID=510951 RepID=F8MPM0_NEUT8|nr:uncharacterized protein NEUTE1DRAFT_117281 [Neurospora tetrasperma FGSC 2508]EGO56332.1 hypothetical protein NEUTE1DRAFT_117281 [Neurospora tetrasperma FGSC 2508]EGZ70811.1 hypothetical protein NEUTE2DRAFT_145194 [Neurospora tetrasperma FGSC 2509]
MGLAGQDTLRCHVMTRHENKPMKKGMFNIWGSRYSQGNRKRRYKEEKGARL